MNLKLNPKFLRAFYTPTATASSTASMALVVRLFYEFWGFCVNGGNNLRVPNGVATSHLTGSYINMPAGFETGSTVLLASGSDGSTTANTPYFTVTGSSPFSPSHVGKWLTIWKSGSQSTDDGIYPITAWINSSSVAVDQTYGGTANGPTGSIPQLTSRSDLNYRVVDYYAAANLAGYVSGSYIVFQFDNASSVNPGQAKSQFQFKLINNNSFSQITNFRIRLSPSGSWNGSQFADSLESGYGDVTIEGVDNDFFRTSAGGLGNVTVIADPTFAILTVGGFSKAGGSTSVMVEVPARLYPQANDPNLVCAYSINSTVFVGTTPGFGYSGRWFPSPHDPSLRRWGTLVPGYVGSTWQGNVFPGNSIDDLDPFTGRYPVLYNQHLKMILVMPAILSLGTFQGQPSIAGQFSLARAVLRSARFIPSGLNKFHRVDDGTNKWIYVGPSVLWPWDNAIVPSRSLFLGTT